MKLLPAPKKPKFNFLSPQIRIVSFSLLLFVVTIGFLVFSPKAVELTQSKISGSFNQPWEKPQYIATDVLGAEKEEPSQIVNLNLSLAPQFSSGAVLAEDLDSGQVLFQKNINQKMSPASTTKLMTALVAVEYFESGSELVVPAGAMVGGSTMGLFVGERLSFRSLLYGMLLNSGNDAAFTIASNYPGGVGAFVVKMNDRAQTLGLLETHFENPAGFDGPTHLSSAYDLAVIARKVAENSQLSRVYGTENTTIVSLDSTKSHVLHNLNQLLGKDGVVGIKTGTTEKAGENFVGLVERNGHKVITVVLKSEDRFGESKALMDWVFQNYRWQ